MADATTPPAGAQTPRPPGPDELRQLADWLRSRGYDPDGAESTARAAFVAVFDHYATGGPGYCGTLLSVVWNGSPTFFDVFLRQGGELVRSERDSDDAQDVLAHSRARREYAAHAHPLSATVTRPCPHCGQAMDIEIDPDSGMHCVPCAIAHETELAFGEILVRRFPQTVSGDLSPLATIRMSRAIRDAADEWICNNVLPPDTDEAAV